MHVNLPPAAKMENNPAAKPAPTRAGKTPAANFGDLLKNAQAGASSTGATPQDLTPAAPSTAS